MYLYIARYNHDNVSNIIYKIGETNFSGRLRKFSMYKFVIKS